MTTTTAVETPERTALRSFLGAQRVSALAIVDGLSDEEMHRSVVPSGWSPMTLMAHLADAEHHWFERVVNGSPAPLVSTTSGVMENYRRQIARSDEILASCGLDDLPRGTVQPEMADTIDTVRDVVLHMVEETARHAGHLDIARELLDGRTGLGPR
ncbi:MAG: hypothetical protein QOJ72_731 [Nocardioidaceae bacterium]|nr:hypothetical protein [Nocardioidaceae bacterium]